MNNLDRFLQEQLTARERKGILRSLKREDLSLIDFTSNDYFGLARSRELQIRIDERAKALNIRNGATGSRLLSGNSGLCEELEVTLANLFKAQACLIFNSGYAANLGVLSSIPNRTDTILYDELCHASIKDGIRLSLATKHSFRHNDLDNLERKIISAKGKVFIVIESIYSMDGDVSPLAQIVALAEQHDCFIVLDEAHSTGVNGQDGAGLAVEMGIHEKIAIRIYTFGKAIGLHGACVAAGKTIIDYLINFAKPFIYTTALPDHTIVAIGESFEFIKLNPHLQRELERKINLFTNSYNTHNVSKTAIQTVVIGSVNETKMKSQKLLQHGFDVRPIYSPTVPEGTERLRICIHTFNLDNDITSLTKLLRE